MDTCMHGLSTWTTKGGGDFLPSPHSIKGPVIRLKVKICQKSPLVQCPVSERTQPDVSGNFTSTA